MSSISSSIILLIILLAGIWTGQGVSYYSLDDPYIHLTLAKNIRHGFYGINPTEWSAPSSSIIWPFLLAVFPEKTLSIAPLIINIPTCIATINIIHRAIDINNINPHARLLGSLLVGFGMNLFGLAYTGMEHSLQVLLCAYIGLKISKNERGALFYAAMIAAPLIRYECLAITLPIAIWLILEGSERLKAALAATTSLLIIFLFSLYLYRHSDSWLPSSVLAKAADRSVLKNLQGQPLILACAGALIFPYKNNLTKWALWAFIPVLLFIVGGRVGWFGRYEVFMAAWVCVLACCEFAKFFPKAPSPTTQNIRNSNVALLSFCFALALGMPSLWVNTLKTPLAVRTISQQQGLMARIVSELSEPVAVNDLGLVAFRAKNYVLDLWGLGSYEALTARLKTGKPQAEWVSKLMHEKNVEHALIYDEWFPDRPNEWLKVAELKLDGARVGAYSDTVSVYSTNPLAACRMLQKIREVKEDARANRLIRLTDEKFCEIDPHS